MYRMVGRALMRKYRFSGKGRSPVWDTWYVHGPSHNSFWWGQSLGDSGGNSMGRGHGFYCAPSPTLLQIVEPCPYDNIPLIGGNCKQADNRRERK